MIHKVSFPRLRLLGVLLHNKSSKDLYCTQREAIITVIARSNLSETEEPKAFSGNPRNLEVTKRVFLVQVIVFDSTVIETAVNARGHW